MAKNNKKGWVKLIANGFRDASDRGKLLEQVSRRLQELSFKVDVAVAKPKEKPKEEAGADLPVPVAAAPGKS